jgi:mono/diheme cytochrome c family protein
MRAREEWARRENWPIGFPPEVFPISTVNGKNAAWRRCAWAAVYAGLAAGAGLGLAGCHKGALTQQQAQGKQLYEARCAHCHEYNDLALKKVPPDLHGVFNRSKLPSGAPATDVQVARTVLTGKNMMPSFAGRFTTQQMEALLAYLHTTQFASGSRP